MKRIAAIILAAGYSRRYGKENKLLANLQGKPVLSHIVDKIALAPLSQRLVVVKPTDSEVASLCDPSAFDIVENKDAANGMGTSIAAGVRNLKRADGVMVVLGDMPFITEHTYLTIIDAFHNNPTKTIFAPSCDGRLGHPVIFRRSHFDQLKALSDDTGAKRILAVNKITFFSLPVSDPGVVSDIDAPL